MADDFNNKLSREDISRLERTLSEAKSLTARQEEILKKVLEGERQIGLERIALLDEYFNDYFKKLKEVSSKTSKLSDSYLILDRLASKKPSARDGQKKSSIAPKSKASSNSRTDGTASKKTTQKKQQEKQTTESKSKRAENKRVNEDKKHSNADNDFTQIQQDISDKELDALGEAAADEGVLAISKFTDALSKGLRETLTSSDEVLQYIQDRDKKHYEDLAKRAEMLHEQEIALAALRENSTKARQNELENIQMTEAENNLRAQLAAEEESIRIQAQIDYWNDAKNAAVRADTVNAEQRAEGEKKLQQELNEMRRKMEAQALAKNGKITEKEQEKINKRLAKKAEEEEKKLDKRVKDRAKEEKKKDGAENRAKVTHAVTAPLSKEDNLMKRFKDMGELVGEGEGALGKAAAVANIAVAAISDAAKALENKIDTIASYQGAIDTRLQGSNNEKYAGSYWDQLVRDMTSVGAINPFFKQEDFANNIKSLVERGIAFDLKQRAFLMTIQNKIANTFDVADGTLLRLIRIQQEDSTAGRLGMESALNAFLNNMYENTEYLQQVADSVRGSLAEMQSLMSGAEAAEVEYQVQKWLGSLYSVGMSDTAVNAISTTLGQIAAGQIEGLTGDGASNLLIMAANEAGIPITDILTRGITSKETNNLLQAAVNYLAELSESAKGNRVVQQQLANVFGVKASDLRAATNLVLPGSIGDISGHNLTYNAMLGRLSDMAGSMWQRTSIAEMMTNFWENGQYTLAGSMASSPVSYLIYKMAKVVDSAAGGIDLPFLNVMGFGVDLNTTVSDLMRVAAVGAGILGSIGPMISGLGNSFSGQAMLRELGIGSGSGLAITPRGGAEGMTTGGGTQTKSESGYAGNASSSDIKDSTIQEAEDSKKQQMIEAKEEEEANKVDILNSAVIKIYELLDDVAHGSGSLKVKIDGYGLTSAGRGASGAQGGVSGLESLSSGSFGGGSRLSGSGDGPGSGIGGDSGGDFGAGTGSGGGTTLSFSGWTVMA